MGKEERNKKISISMKYPNGITKIVNGDTIDDLISSLEEINDGRFINEFLRDFPNLKENQLKELDRIILGTDNATWICNYAKQRQQGCNLKKFEDRLIKLGNVEVLIDLARDVKGVDIIKIQEAVIKSRNPKAIARFYEQVEGAGFEKCKEALFELKAAGYLWVLFERDFINFPKAIDMNDWHKAESIVIESKDTDAITMWAKKRHSSPNIQNAIITSKDPKAIFYFARDVEGSDKHKLRKAMMSTNNKYWIGEWKAYFGLQGIFS